MASAADTPEHAQIPPDSHLEWWSRLAALRLELAKADNDGDETAEHLMDGITDLERLIAGTPARSLTGVIAKLELLLLYTAGDIAPPCRRHAGRCWRSADERRPWRCQPADRSG